MQRPGQCVRWFSSILAALIVASCSNQQIYTAVQENQRQECGKLPQVQYEKCMRDFEMSYEEYDEQRQAILEED